MSGTHIEIKRIQPSGHSFFAWLRLRAGRGGSHAQGGEAISLQAYSWIDGVLARIAARFFREMSRAAIDKVTSNSTLSATKSAIVVLGGHFSAMKNVRLSATCGTLQFARSLIASSIDSSITVWSWFIYAASLLVSSGQIRCQCSTVRRGGKCSKHSIGNSSRWKSCLARTFNLYGGCPCFIAWSINP